MLCTTFSGQLLHLLCYQQNWQKIIVFLISEIDTSVNRIMLTTAVVMIAWTKILVEATIHDLTPRISATVK